METYTPIMFQDFGGLPIGDCCLETLAVRDGPPRTIENYRVTVRGMEVKQKVIRVFYHTLSTFNRGLGVWTRSEESAPLVIFEKKIEDLYCGPFRLTGGDIIWIQGVEDILFRRIYMNSSRLEPAEPIDEEELFALQNEMCVSRVDFAD